MKELKNLYYHSHKLFFSKTAINTYFVFGGNGLSAIFAFIFTVIYVRNLSYEDVGYFSALLSLLLLASDLADMGIGTSMSAFLPPLEETKSKLLAFLKTSFFFQLTVGLLFSLVIFFFATNLSQLLFHTGTFTFFLQITALGIFMTIMANFCQYALSARQRFITVAFLSSFGGFIRLLLLVVILLISTLTLANTIYVHIASVFLLMSVSLLLLKLDFFKEKITRQDLKKLISFSYLLGIARGLTALASRLDVLMIVALRGPADAGIYAIASRVIALYPLLSGSFSTVIAPRLSSSSDKKQLSDFMRKVIIGTLGLIATVVFLIIIAQPFMVILFGEKGEAAVSVFRLLLTSMIFFVASVPAVSLSVYFLKKPHILTINSILQLMVVILGNLTFIPLFGNFGAAYSLIIAYGVTLLLTSFLAYYYFKKSYV